jgi:dTDP-4-amino-4,6-dideoxygalactose transaminase
MRVPFTRVCCDGNELQYVREVLESGWLTTGEKAADLERRFRDAVGGSFACAVNSCTAALHLAVEALGLGPGDKVLVPTMTFTATAEVLRHVGAIPVFLDIEYGTCLLTPALLESALARTPDAKAVMVVHFGGQAAAMLPENGTPGLLSVAARYGVPLIEDAAHAFPTRQGGRMVGAFGDVTCFSFYATKTISTGEGGMLVTNDERVFQRAKLMRAHGINNTAWDRKTSTARSWEYDVVAPGFKYNLPDVMAAIGLAQLERAHAMRHERQRCASFYYEQLGAVEEIDLPVCRGAPEDHSWHLFPICLNEHSQIDRNRFILLMNAAGIETSVHFKPLHRMSYYRERFGLGPGGFPNAERHWRGTVSLPIYPSLTPDQLAYVCTTIRRIVRGNRKSPRVVAEA